MSRTRYLAQAIPSSVSHNAPVNLAVLHENKSVHVHVRGAFQIAWSSCRATFHDPERPCPLERKKGLAEERFQIAELFRTRESWSSSSPRFSCPRQCRKSTSALGPSYDLPLDFSSWSINPVGRPSSIPRPTPLYSPSSSSCDPSFSFSLSLSIAF